MCAENAGAIVEAAARREYPFLSETGAVRSSPIQFELLEEKHSCSPFRGLPELRPRPPAHPQPPDSRFPPPTPLTAGRDGFSPLPQGSRAPLQQTRDGMLRFLDTATMELPTPSKGPVADLDPAIRLPVENEKKNAKVAEAVKLLLSSQNTSPFVKFVLNITDSQAWTNYQNTSGRSRSYTTQEIAWRVWQG